MSDDLTPFDRADNFASSIRAARDVDFVVFNGKRDEVQQWVHVADKNKNALEEIEDQFVPRDVDSMIKEIAGTPTLIVTFD